MPNIYHVKRRKEGRKRIIRDGTEIQIHVFRTHYTLYTKPDSDRLDMRIMRETVTLRLTIICLALHMCIINGPTHFIIIMLQT